MTLRGKKGGTSGRGPRNGLIAPHRRKVPFSSVNRRGSPEHDPGMQRHHLLPRQLLSACYFSRMFDAIGREQVRFDGFRVNSLLLPSTEVATIRTGMPLHRGPHRRYNELVIERVGRIEESWSAGHGKNTERALFDALARLTLLQGALRLRLLRERKRSILNQKDPIDTGFDFGELDAMAEDLWKAT